MLSRLEAARGASVHGQDDGKAPDGFVGQPDAISDRDQVGLAKEPDQRAESAGREELERATAAAAPF